MEKTEILWEDNSLLLCVKPVGLLSQPDAQGHDNLLQQLQQGRDYVGLVHRLDRGVGGVMVFSKKPAMTAQLSRLFQNRECSKEYLAVICGVPEEKQGVLKDLLFRDAEQNKTYVVDRLRKGVREASLEYSLLQTTQWEGQTLSLLRVRLHTGRTHQIRVQFASRGLPLLGDRRYGGSSKGNIALWSWRLSFRHPFRHMQVQAERLPPADNPWSLFAKGEQLL